MRGAMGAIKLFYMLDPKSGQDGRFDIESERNDTLIVNGNSFLDKNTLNRLQVAGDETKKTEIILKTNNDAVIAAVTGWVLVCTCMCLLGVTMYDKIKKRTPAKHIKKFIKKHESNIDRVDSDSDGSSNDSLHGRKIEKGLSSQSTPMLLSTRSSSDSSSS